ncbi:putative F-box/LRR-repeat protein At3g58880 [Papaver somniferum]|uniref:putative F-box/LRR-repeat protein At3g58880 n=1 Tax=Papaver somniferum TaxID=3469 RepID=UPI000E704C91|nr:putative F-box/LRR-repeat protein At3g58880 [Papaver somniferum]
MREAAKDRITDLPDSLLHHIHSFLHIVDSARTSILSKRWNYIWTTVPILEFTNCANAKTEKFMDFVDGTLDRHNSSNVDKFSLVSTYQLNESRFHSWIATLAISHSSKYLLTFQNVKILKLTCKITTDGELAILKAVPNLESLIFEVYVKEEVERSDKHDHISEAAECLFPHLKSVVFRQFSGNPRERKWVRLILKYAEALEILTIRHCGSYLVFRNARSEKELMVEILNYSKASPGCVIKFCSLD